MTNINVDYHLILCNYCYLIKGKAKFPPSMDIQPNDPPSTKTPKTWNTGRVISKEGNFIGRGIYNHNSNIGIRLLTENVSELLGQEFSSKN